MAKTYNCPFCQGRKFDRHKLPKHMDKEHFDEMPEGITPYRFAYDIINNHPDHHGHCTVCGKITEWDEKTQKYRRLCGDKKCYEAIKKTYHERMMRVYNKPHLMDDVNHLEKMLAHRKISGKYKWSDGKVFTYTGSYEKNFLEFLDKVMEYRSDEIISPGPVLEYDYKGKKHKWITDVMILPYNLIVEIKDGGDNKNGNTAWKGTRAKTIAKEVMITNLGKYNYIRLTNNDFAQFLGIIAELKMQIVDDTVSPLYRIHEDTSLDEESLPEVIEAIDNPYMLREAQEWEHLTHMWGNAIDDIIGNVTNSPFEVAKGSYIDHDPETGKEVCVMRTIRPKAELKNREYRNRLKKQMYHLQQKINKAYNIHPSVMFIQYPIDNTNLTEGLIVGITKTSR